MTDHIQAEVKKLHAEIGASERKNLEAALRIGELLTEKKLSLKRGEWGTWIKQSGIPERQDSRYRQLYEHRKLLKKDMTLSAAYEAVQFHGQRPPPPPNKPLRSILGISKADVVAANNHKPRSPVKISVTGIQVKITAPVLTPQILTSAIFDRPEISKLLAGGKIIIEAQAE